MMRSALKLLFVAAVLCMAAMRSVYPQAGMITPESPEAQALVERVQRTGLVQIIVQLDITVELEADLPSHAAREAQRARISAAQTSLLERIGPAGVRSVTRYQHVPLIAMTVNARALEALLSSPEVMAVQESVPAPPALANSVPLIDGDTGWAASGLAQRTRTIAILDTGIDTGHLFLSNKTVDEACFSGTAPNSQSSAPMVSKPKSGRVLALAAR